MNFKELFLKLTEYTVPFGYEETLEPLLPSGWKKDNIGNYYYEIGNSKTLFTSHLDTACKEREKVNHIVDGNIIKTDGTTILGGDKVILLSVFVVLRGLLAKDVEFSRYLHHFYVLIKPEYNTLK
jgi:hypothetical protein